MAVLVVSGGSGLRACLRQEEILHIIRMGALAAAARLDEWRSERFRRSRALLGALNEILPRPLPPVGSGQIALLTRAGRPEQPREECARR
jgi:hypothetical protein